MNSAKLSGQWGAFTIMGFNCFHISSVHPMATTKVPRTILKVFWTEQCSKYDKKILDIFLTKRESFHCGAF